MKSVSLFFARGLFAILTASLLFAQPAQILLGQTPTTIQITGNVQQQSVSRMGVNLGDQTFYDSGQMLKNLIFKNPGFEGLSYRVILHCAQVTATTCTDDNQFNAQPSGYWNGGSYRIMTGAAAGTTGSVVSFTNNSNPCSGCGPTVQFDQAVGLAAGDYLSLTTYIPGNGDAGWWDSISGGGSISTETTDLSSETAGKQALVLNAAGASATAAVTQYFDSYNGVSFVQLKGSFAITFRAKSVAGNNRLNVTAKRLSQGNSAYLNQWVQLTNSWQDYTLTFSANETGSAVGTVELAFLAAGGTVELDDVAMQQTDSSAANSTVFRDDVVNALAALNPGTIRMMAGNALGSDLPNQLQLPLARYREGFNADSSSIMDIPYGIHEFLQLCQTVGADPWITIPTATTPDEMTDFIEYLTGNGSDPWSSLRIARGQAAPWTSVFGKVHIELGNETWNGIFKGETMGFPGYPQWANTVFGAARQTPGFVAGQFDLILGGWSAVPGYNSQLLSVSKQHDSIDVAPYLLFSANNEPLPTVFGALFAESELFESPGGQVYRNFQLAAGSASATSKSTNLSVYETNLSPTQGNITEAQLNQLTPSVGAGIGHAVHMLQMQRLGVKYQNAFSLPQYSFLRSDGNLVKLWGVVVDMGTTNRRRPTYLTEALANSAIGGTMLQTVQTGANPTWNQPLSSDGVQLNGAHYLQSFAYLNNANVTAILFNLSQTAALPVNFSGENAPTGAVTITQITSSNITDTNESADLIEPSTQTVAAFNPSNGLTLPPFSMTVLSWTSAFAQSPLYSVPAGTYSTTQSVALSSLTPGASIYYTTDGSAPTPSSMPYTSPLRVSQTQTIQAISIAPNLATSPISTSLYTIQSVAPAPVFSPAGGTYSSGQLVTIQDSVAGAAIYYTTDGSLPTAASKLYQGPLTVSASETLSAIAIAPNWTNSPPTQATYTIALPTPPPTFSVAPGTYPHPQNVQISDSLAGTKIYYTLDGTTPTVKSMLYNGFAAISQTATLKAIAVATGRSSSSVTSCTYVIAPYAALPSISIPSGTYAAPQTVTIADATPGAVIHYTTDQSTPTKSSPLYTGPITITGAQYLQAIAIATGYTQSFIASANYNVTGTTVGTPILSVTGGAYYTAQTVAIKEATPGAVLYYTTDGSLPTSASTPYSGPITVGSSELLQVIGVKAGLTNSAVAKAAYTIRSLAAEPVFSIPSGTYSSSQTVSISDSTPGASVYYSINGKTALLYTAPITVNASETIQALANAPGFGNSPIASVTYTISSSAAKPALKGKTQNVGNDQGVSLHR